MDSALKNNEPKKIVERGYDKVTHDYARLEGEIAWPRMKWLEKLLDQLEPGASVLDLGCGSGDPADIEISKQHHVTGVDISQAQIELACKNVPGGEFIHMDAGLVDFSPASFDAVVSFYTLEHIPRREHKEILQRIYVWLKPGGYVLISIEAGEYEDETGEWLGVPMFFSCFDPETMKRMVIEAGFELIETAVEIQLEDDHEVPFLWLFGRK
jgi:cyclopropane fatty-acyl-phospholipid synthase-like methyltransferase